MRCEEDPYRTQKTASLSFRSSLALSTTTLTPLALDPSEASASSTDSPFLSFWIKPSTFLLLFGLPQEASCRYR